ncbi:MAG: DNA repair protein RecO [Patescibacteria group bacterium]
MIQNLTGILLRKREYGEKDLMLTVLSCTGERLDLVIKGANIPNSRRRAHLELMNLIEGTTYQSTHHLYLQNVQVKNSFTHLKENVSLVFRLAIFLEILEHALQSKDPQPEIYALLLETLQNLNANPNPFLPEAALIKLAHLLGFLPSFKQCNLCHEALEDIAHWDQEAGTLSCTGCRKTHHRPLELKYRKAFEFFRHASAEQCSKVQLQAHEAETLREWIPSFFSLHLDRPLKTLQVQVSSIY